MMHFVLDIIFGWIMYQCCLTQPKYNRAFAVLSALFFGLTGLTASAGVPQILQHPVSIGLGRAITAPPAKRLIRKH
jgi:hypothetical protein